MSLLTLDDIPHVADEYRRGTLKSTTPSSRTPNQIINAQISRVKYDITKLRVDAIVNAANSSLLGGGGVDGAIHRAAGRELVAACRQLEGCKTGSAKITAAFNLPCEYVIHAVGPDVGRFGDRSRGLLRSCYQTSLEIAVQKGCRSVAFSAISTGVYGYPSEDAAKEALDVVRGFLEGEDGDKLDRVIFVLFMPAEVNAYEKFLPQWFPPTEEDPAQSTDANQVAGTDQADKGEESVSQQPAKSSDPSDHDEALTAAILPNAPTAEPSDATQPPTKKAKVDDVRVQGDVAVQSVPEKDEKAGGKGGTGDS